MYVSITRNEKNESVGCSVVSDSFVTLWTVAQQVPPSMGFSRQEYWSGLPFPSPGDLPNPGIEGRSSALWEDSLLSEPPRKLHQSLGVLYKSTEKKNKDSNYAKLGWGPRVCISNMISHDRCDARELSLAWMSFWASCPI